MNDLLVELFRHNTWANLKMIEFCRDLPPAQRDRDFKIVGTYGAIRDTLHHMIGSQEGYLYTYGRSKEAPAEAFTTWDALLERVRKSSEACEAGRLKLLWDRCWTLISDPRPGARPPGSSSRNCSTTAPNTAPTSAPPWRIWASSRRPWTSGSTAPT
jgi:hypothetical protein